MRSSFFEFNVATSALFTAKNGLSVVGHNIANASTEGYSRQYAIQQASTPLSTHNRRGMVGTGSEVVGVGQVRSFYLDRQYWHQSATVSQYTTKVQQLSFTEAVFNERSESSISNYFSKFFATIQNLATSANDTTFRTDVLSTSQSLVTNIQATAKSLQKQQTDANDEIEMVVQRINTLGEQIANLNEKIYKFEHLGQNANDLRDQRALLVDELSKYVNVDVTERDGKYTVMIDGNEFVSHYDCIGLTVKARESGAERNAMDAEGLYDIVFANGGTFDIYSASLTGELKGLIDVRDGSNGVATSAGTPGLSYRGIPYYLEQLNTLVQTFARAMNEGLDSEGNAIPNTYGGHVNGYDEEGKQNGLALFTYINANGDEESFPFGGGTPADYSQMTIFNFCVNSEIVNNPKLLACSTSDIPEESNNNIILGMASVANYKSLLNQGTLNDYAISLAGQLGVDLKEAKSYEVSYAEIKVAADNRRIQVSGVSYDEEIVSMITYQQQYQAASKLISVINDLYDRMINQMGVS